MAPLIAWCAAFFSYAPRADCRMSWIKAVGRITDGRIRGVLSHLRDFF
ncbi:hypothetical protein HLH36_11950 [Gluconacetobacter aggeris]|uniref:Uncharacterized protein n=1 Tax=Gluconacetobacter aggeris TaxID=1286186 RepID=A0A7W4NYY8_9PROT|nr:hypothetical protein [Gluconacetobacter aggeris]MBB2169063.1 hypothetical protein [Gluconacetobacter aggeris]